MNTKGYLNHIKIHTISLALATASVILYAVLLFMKPEIFTASLSAWARFFMFFLPFVVAIIGVLGIMDAHLPPETVSKYLGDKRKIHGYLFALLFGTVVSSSQYAVFPTVKLLRKKGARTAILATFMVMWSGVSLPIIPLELSIFGPKFVFMRIIIIAIGAVVFGVLTGMRDIHMER